MSTLFSSPTAKLQQEWSEKLQRTAADLQSAATAAFRSHAAYVEAMERLGALYVYCGTLVNRVSAQHLSDAPPAAELRNATETSTRLHSSLKRWRDAGEEFELHTFLQTQTTHWQACERELARSMGDYKRRNDVSELADKARSKLKETGKKSSAVGKLEKDVAALDANLKVCEARVRQNISGTAKGLCKDVSHMSIKLIDMMSACGQTCAITFQPIGTSLVDMLSESGRDSRRHEVQDKAMAGVVLHRPAAAQAGPSSCAHPTGGVTYGEPSLYLSRESTSAAVIQVRASEQTDSTVTHRDPTKP